MMRIALVGGAVVLLAGMSAWYCLEGSRSYVHSSETSSSTALLGALEVDGQEEDLLQKEGRVKLAEEEELEEADPILIPPGRTGSGLLACLDDCRGELPRLSECILNLALAEQPSAKELADRYCAASNGAAGRNRHEVQSESLVIVSAMMAARRGNGVVDFLHELQVECEIFEEPLFLIGVVKHLLSLGDEWMGWLDASLEPHFLFGEESKLGTIYMAGEMALQGSEWARYLLEEGSRGMFGGKGNQVFFACNMSFPIQKDGAESFQYLESVRKSQALADQQGVGDFLGMMYLTPNAQEGGDPENCLRSLLSLLDDERFARNVALQILHNANRNPPFAGALGESMTAMKASPLWEGLLARASQVRDELRDAVRR